MMNKTSAWRSCTLESVARLVSGRTPEREQKEYYAEEGTPWVKIENLNRGVITEAAEYLSDRGREKVNLVPAGSVLFSIVGTVGKVGMAGRELATNQQIVALIFDETRVLPKYGYYCMVYHAGKIRDLSDQTTMALISRKTLGQYRIAIPESLEKQKEIVENLERFETLVWKKKGQRREVDVYEQLFFDKTFGSEMRYHERLPLKEYLAGAISNGPVKEKENTIVSKREILLKNGRLLLGASKEIPYFQDRGVLRILTQEKRLLPEVLYGYLNQREMQAVLYGERKTGESRKRPIRASELERMEVPYFSMEKQQYYAQGWKKIHKIQWQMEQEIALARRIFRAALREFLEEPYVEEEKQPIDFIEDREKGESLDEMLLNVLKKWKPEKPKACQGYEERCERIFKEQQEKKEQKKTVREALLLLLEYVDLEEE